jgi:ornithine cyclodeaminase
MCQYFLTDGRTFTELDTECVQNAIFFGDSKEAVFKEAGEFTIPLSHGKIEENHFKGELSDLVCKKVAGRTSDKDITLFKSLGMAVEDLASAIFLYNKAKKMGCGKSVALS